MTSYPRSSTSRINSDAFRAGMTDGRQFENTVNHAANLHVSFNQVPRAVSDEVIENINNIKKIKNIFSENISSDASTSFSASGSNSHRDLIPPTPPMFHSHIPANTLVSPSAATDGSPSIISSRDRLEPNFSGDLRSPLHSEKLVEQRLGCAKAPLPVEENYVSKSPVESTNSTLVDKITMEYMMNKQHYKKYLAKTNNSKYEITKQNIQKVSKYQDEIVIMVEELIKNYIAYGNFTKYNTDVNHFFESFMMSAVCYLEENPQECMVTEDDDDTMFANIGTYGSSRP